MNKSFIIQESAIPVVPERMVKKGDVLEFVTVLQEADKKNRNGRVYPRKVLEEGIRAPYVQERLRTKSLLSECGHPQDTSIARQMTIDFKNTVCMIKEIFWEGNLLKGRCETLNTRLGRDFKNLIEQGSIVGFSLRAQGNVHPDPVNGGVIVDSPISICTWDYVINPSHSGAFLEKICEESYNSLIGTERAATGKYYALMEAANTYENGNLIALKEEVKKEEKDYISSYYNKTQALNEIYIPEEKDRVACITENANSIILENEKIRKKVLLEDYLIKDIRKHILNI